jgi:hypothetical protein
MLDHPLNNADAVFLHIRRGDISSFYKRLAYCVKRFSGKQFSVVPRADGT